MIFPRFIGGFFSFTLEYRTYIRIYYICKHLFGVIVMIAKYIGRRVEIIYQSADGRLSQRVVRVLGVRDGVVRAFCEVSGAPRTFRVDNILAVQPAVRSA